MPPVVVNSYVAMSVRAWRTEFYACPIQSNSTARTNLVVTPDGVNVRHGGHLVHPKNDQLILIVQLRVPHHLIEGIPRIHWVKNQRRGWSQSQSSILASGRPKGRPSTPTLRWRGARHHGANPYPNVHLAPIYVPLRAMAVDSSARLQATAVRPHGRMPPACPVDERTGGKVSRCWLAGWLATWKRGLVLPTVCACLADGRIG